MPLVSYLESTLPLVSSQGLLTEGVALKSFVIVPCKNEALNIHALVAEFNLFSNSEIELWLVEGGSHDGTGKICSDYSLEFQNVHFLEQLGFGKFRAVRTVIEHLQSKGEIGTVVIWDADHSIRFDSIHSILLKPFPGDKYLFTERIGSFIEEGAMPRLNNLGNRVIAFFASVIFRFKISDALSGTKFFPLSMFQNLKPELIKYLDRDTYGDLSYFLLARIHNYKFEKVKVDYFARTYGTSSLKRLTNGLELLRSLYKAFVLLQRNFVGDKSV